jgi:hypothetical protein
MAREEFLLIKSVVGFEHKDVPTEIVEADGTVRLYKGGIRSTYVPDVVEHILSKECNPRWFTNFNQALLDKLRDYHKNNL